jgi:hypothetical protein
MINIRDSRFTIMLIILTRPVTVVILISVYNITL